MKAPITQAQAWAVIAESAGWNAKELPVLPAPDVHGLHAFSESTLKAYGAACACNAREMALSESVEQVTTLYEGDEAPYLIDICKEIEALKGK